MSRGLGDVYKRQILHRAGITATLRDTRGSDIDGACGQLAAKTKEAFAA